MGQHLQAVVQLERSLALQRELHGPLSSQPLATLNMLAESYAKMPARRGNAIQCYTELVEARRTKFGENDLRGAVWGEHYEAKSSSLILPPSSPLPLSGLLFDEAGAGASGHGQ